MNQPEKIERYGHLNKYEKLTNVSSTKIPGTLVLEAPEPFPGYLEYYSERPHHSSPLYVYLVIQGRSSLEEVARATQKARDMFESRFEAAFAEIKFKNETLEAIRVRNLDNFSQIPHLQEVYNKAGIKFERRTREINATALITIKKLFHLKEVQEGIYLDVGELDQGYFKLPTHVKWADFKELVQRVKYNWISAKSDFALGFFYTNDQVVDVVRVFNPELSPELLVEAYQQFMNRL